MDISYDGFLLQAKPIKVHLELGASSSSNSLNLMWNATVRVVMWFVCSSPANIQWLGICVLLSFL